MPVVITGEDNLKIREVIPGTAATDLGKAVGGAYTGSETGALVIGVNDQTGAYVVLRTTNANVTNPTVGPINYALAVETQPNVMKRTAVFTTISSDTSRVGYWKNFSLMVNQTGVVTAWDVRLEGSLDDTTFTQILAHTNVTGTGVMVAATTPFCCSSWRLRCAGLTLGAGTNVQTIGLAMN